MKVVLQTKLTPAITVYDSSAAGGQGSALLRFLGPVVAVTDDAGNVIYQSGEFGPTLFPWVAGGLAVVGILLVATLARGKA